MLYHLYRHPVANADDQSHRARAACTPLQFIKEGSFDGDRIMLEINETSSLSNTTKVLVIS